MDIWIVSLFGQGGNAEMAAMKVALFGASDATGLLLMERCLAAEYEVTALLRRPVKFPYLDHPTVIGCDIFTLRAVYDTIHGENA